MTNRSISTWTLAALLPLSWFATAAGFVNMTSQGKTGAALFAVVIIAGAMSAAVQGLMVLFFVRSTQPVQVSPTRGIFAMFYLLCVAISVSFGISTYSQLFNITGTQIAQNNVIDKQAVQKHYQETLTLYDDTIAMLGAQSTAISNVATAEGAGKCGTLCTKYTITAGALKTAQKKLQADLHKLNTDFSALNDLNGTTLAQALRDFNQKLVVFAAPAHFTTVETIVDAALSDTNFDVKTGGLNTRNRKQSYVTSINAVQTYVTSATHPTAPTLAEIAVNNATTQMAKAVATLKNLVSMNFVDITESEWIAILMALLVDSFILMVLIMNAQKSAIEDIFTHAQPVHSPALKVANRLAEEAGYENINEAVTGTYNNASAVALTPNLMGQLVAVPTPKTSTKINDFMRNLTTINFAYKMPNYVARFFATSSKDAEATSNEVCVYWIPRRKWIELESLKMLEMTTPKLVSTMTFGEFTDWACSLPESTRLFPNAKRTRAILSDYFAHAWSLPLEKLSKTRMNELLDNFEAAANLKEGTKMAYRRTFRSMVALAAHKGLLPTEANTPSLRVVA